MSTPMPTPSLTTLIPAERILTISSASLEAQAGHAPLQIHLQAV
ncbi:hypothetical protein [Rhodoferax aquaticus]|nr:hypothetical protein [Rhodoferax aquaticus]